MLVEDFHLFIQILNPEPLINYMNEIKKELNNLKLEKLPEIICEPGRALVAESGSTIVKVILRKKNNLIH